MMRHCRLADVECVDDLADSERTLLGGEEM